MVDRTLDELILEDGGKRGRKGKGGGGNRKGGSTAAGKSGEKCPWGGDVKALEGSEGQAFWLHDDRAGGGPVDESDAPWMQSKGKGAKGESWGPVRGGGKGGGRSDPYDRSAGAEGKWRHDLFDGSMAASYAGDDDKYSYSGLYGPRGKGKADRSSGKGKDKGWSKGWSKGKGKGKGKWRSDMDYWW
eukprot:TRINITY_DN2312_c0_g1_i2.p1 TRINITY_DN2312_c0_g1~~TRINITY_DN2312_c0_g1_i2.p1  ORF type:complete len:207 (-),score=45.73 TRINITY_DN2312_c0_g1_i2:210-770(-)